MSGGKSEKYADCQGFLFFEFFWRFFGVGATVWMAMSGGKSEKYADCQGFLFFEFFWRFFGVGATV